MLTVTRGLVVLLAVLATVVAVTYSLVARDRTYRRFIEQGETALAADRSFEAIEAFSGALDLKPDSMLAHLRRGGAYRQRRDLQAALRDLRAASRLDPTATQPWEEIGDVNYQLERDARAIEAYEVYVTLDERSARVLYKLGLSRYRAGDVNGALGATRQAMAIDDRFAEASYLLGLCLVEQKQPEEAIVALQRAVALQPGLVPPREELAALYARQGRSQDSIQQLEALAALDPIGAARHIALGLGYARSGQRDLAVITLGRAAERLPNEPDVYVALGRVWLQAAETRGDRSALRKALEALGPVATRPTASTDALALYGEALLLAGETAQAETMLRQATSSLPVDPDTLVHLATAAQRLGHVEVERQALVRQDALSPDEGDRAARTVRIGDLSLALNDLSGAVHWYERASTAAPSSHAIAQKLAQARGRLARRSTAVP